MNKIFIASLSAYFLLLSGCANLKDAGHAYFKPGHKMVGVEPPEQVIERMAHEKEIRHIMYGHLKASKVIQCTFLRNQLYVAATKSLSGQDGHDIKQAATMLEHAYQQDDQAFLSVCDQVLSMRVGETLSAIQKEFLADRL